MRFRHVLIVEELHRGPRLLEEAALLAARPGGHVHLVSAGAAGPEPRSPTRTAVLGRLEERAALLRARGLHVTTGVLAGSNPEGIAREAARARSDLVVKRRERRGKLDALLRRDCDRLLLRRCPCPLWLVDEEDSSAGPVLAAVDPADHDASLDAGVLDAAAVLADGFGADLHVVNAWSAPLMPMLGRVSVDQRRNVEVFQQGIASAFAAVQRCTARRSIPPEHVHLARGDPRDVLPAVAEELGARVLVLGEDARERDEAKDRVAAALRPKVAEHVLLALRCSLLVLHPLAARDPARARSGVLARRFRLVEP
jgi:universal stress protein E